MYTAEIDGGHLEFRYRAKEGVEMINTFWPDAYLTKQRTAFQAIVRAVRPIVHDSVSEYGVVNFEKTFVRNDVASIYEIDDVQDKLAINFKDDLLCMTARFDQPLSTGTDSPQAPS